MKDYSEFFTHIVANHLHKLVDLVKSSRREKILVHKWILGIEYNWPEYIHVSDDNSEFIPRLSFWIGGLRDRFNSDPKKSEVLEMLDKTFDASTFCFFEYGARDDVLKQIEKYTKEVDEFFGEDILTHKLKKFKLSQKIVKIVNNAFGKLVDFGVKQDKIDSIKISKNIDSASDLEKEFNKLIEIIVEFSVTSRSDKVVVMDFVDKFLSDCKKIGYNRLDLLLRAKLFLLFKLSIEVSKDFGVNKDNLAYITLKKEILFTDKLEKKSNKIIEDIIRLFVKSTAFPKNEVINYLEEFLGECQKLEYDKSVLYIKITNIFKMSIKNLEVSLKIGKKSIKGKTDDKGEIVFMEIPKGCVTLSFNHKKEREYTIEINKAFNKKNIWLFSL